MNAQFKVFLHPKHLCHINFCCSFNYLFFYSLQSSLHIDVFAIMSGFELPPLRFCSACSHLNQIYAQISQDKTWEVCNSLRSRKENYFEPTVLQSDRKTLESHRYHSSLTVKTNQCANSDHSPASHVCTDNVHPGKHNPMKHQPTSEYSAKRVKLWSNVNLALSVVTDKPQVSTNSSP